ncbi:hypothetical protein BZB76_0953 [Actinomadura pelletieri DSM 43383]|uniref:Uncharacterized protein n=1 Tax=Actinomadura pelletieri DSM 43383 TaxID=1120940 RepID=A0A495QZ73_9ACTN|nr:hypothetical protein BZB76_0953 [Actinomadura pelletieri DSM 43383]
MKILKPEAQIGAGDLRDRWAAVRRFDLAEIPIARPLSLLVGDQVGYTMELLAGMTATAADHLCRRWGLRPPEVAPRPTDSCTPRVRPYRHARHYPGSTAVQ